MGAERITEISQQAGYGRGTFLAMGSPCELLMDSNDPSLMQTLLDLVSGEAWRIEDKFSRYLRGNVVDKINVSNGKAVEIDDETARLLDFADMLTNLSGGAFDITVGPLVELWSFGGGPRPKRLPTEQEIAEGRSRVGYENIAVRLDPRDA